MQLIFKCAHCNTILVRNSKYTGFSHITLPRKCPSCNKELRDVESINVIEPKIAKQLDPPLHSSTTNTSTTSTNTSTTSSTSIIDDNIDDADYTDHTYPLLNDKLILIFNVPEYAIPYHLPKAAHRGKFYSLSTTHEKQIFNKILIISRMLAVKKEIVLLETFRIVNDIVRKSKPLTVSELDKLIAVTLYIVAHAYGVSADKEIVMDIVTSESEFKKIAKMIISRFRFSKTVLISIAVSEIASNLYMTEKQYMKTLMFAQQLRYLNTTPRQIAALAAYIVYNTYALLTNAKIISQDKMQIFAKTVSKIKTVEILLV